eukprot:Skav213751  [mRNA]  locus=scaffold258:93072:94800:+ [translate_table: standard]
MLRTRLLSHEQTHVYTDGSCSFPAMPLHRRAAFAIVINLGTVAAPNMVTFALGECPGRQTIDRAELAAVARFAQICAEENLPTEQISLHTDSSYVVGSHMTVRDDMRNALFQLQKMSNTDLLLELREGRHTFTLCKIKSHQNPAEQPDPAVRTHILGNAAADTAAKLALQRFQTLTPVLESPSDYQDAMTTLQNHYSYLHDLQKARAVLFQAAAAPEPLGCRSRSLLTQVQQLEQWNPVAADNTAFFDALPVDKLHDFLWGTRYGKQLLAWMRELSWPSRPDPCSAGVTWFELTRSFQWFVQEGIVINRGAKDDLFDPFRVPLGSVDVPFAQQLVEPPTVPERHTVTFDAEQVDIDDLISGWKYRVRRHRHTARTTSCDQVALGTLSSAEEHPKGHPNDSLLGKPWLTQIISRRFEGN